MNREREKSEFSLILCWIQWSGFSTAFSFFVPVSWSISANNQEISVAVDSKTQRKRF